jgi:hypothetical protein
VIEIGVATPHHTCISKFSPQWLFAGIRRERSKLRPDRCRHERDGEAKAFDRKFLSEQEDVSQWHHPPPGHNPRT